LVVRAKDEATRALTTIESALSDLISTQRELATGSQNTASGLSKVVTTLAGLDSAYAKISGAADMGAAAFRRQESAIAANQSQLAALKGQSEGAARALDALGAKLVDALLNKADAGPLRAQITEVRNEMTRLDREAGKLQRTIEQQQTGYQRSASSLGELERQTQLVGSVTTFAKQEADQLTRSLNSQADAAQNAARVQASIARATDSRGGLSARDSADAFTAAGLTRVEKQIEAEAAATARATQAERDRSAQIELTNNALRARARIEGNGGSAGSAADTAFAQQLREEEQAAIEAARAEKELIQAAARLKAELNPLAVIQDRLNKELAEANTLYRAGKISATELAQAQALLKANADKAAGALGQQSSAGGKPTLFGLKPYDVQNLGFQVNDIVTQLGSGTSLTQTLAQQGGQILQIFPRVGSAIVAAFTNPVVLAFAVTLGTIVVGLKEVGDEADRVRGFLGLLATSADGGDYNAGALNNAAEALDKYGLSAADAVKAVRIFVKEGVDQSRLEEFGKTATDLAEVMGVELKQAAEEVAKAFTGGYTEIKKLDDSYNFLTAAQRESIKTMFEEGGAAEARNEALLIFSGQQEDAANKMRGPWASAVRELSGAWQEFKSFLSDLAPIRGASAALEGLGRLARTVIRSLRSTSDAASAAQGIAEKQKQIADLERTLATSPNDRLATQQLANARRQLEFMQRQLATVEKTGEAEKVIADTRAVQAEATKKASEDLSRQTREAEQRKTLEGDVAKARREAQEYVEREFKLADQATKNAYINQKVEEARTEALKRAADARKREADEARRAAEERRRGYAADIDDNGREGLVSTARRFQGMNETQNRGDLQSFFRQNGINVDPKMTAWCAAFVNAVLATNGLPGTGSLAARSFLGYGSDVNAANAKEGDIVVLKRGGNNAQGHVGFFQGFDDKGNVRVLGGNQSDGVNTKSFARDDVLGFRRAPNAAQVAKEEFVQAEKLAEKQEQYGEAVDRSVRAREQDTQQLREQFGLQGEALLAKQREAAIEDAIRKAKEDAKKAGIAENDPELLKRIEKLREVEGAYFDAANAKNKFDNERNAVQQPVDDLTALRDRIQQQIQYFQETGQTGLANQLTPQLDAVNLKLGEAIQKAQAFYAALANNPTAMAALGLTKDQIEAIRIGLTASAQAGQSLGYVMGISGQQIAQTFASTAVSAIDKFSQAIANGENVMGALKDAFLQFASDFLRQIATMILQQLIFNAISAGLKAIGLGGVGVPVAHGGGVVGGAMGVNRSVSPAWFGAAARYHTGGIAGLRPNEVPAILERGEEVLTRDDPRHRANGATGGASSAEDRVKNVVFFDPADAMAAALNTRAGEKAILTWMRANGRAVQQAIG
jgi:uncharacterized protein (TIGR02594 family)